ncbi:MAG: hypothetical protein KAT68_11565 [Bacteroidales bacterium]|nr:hypothetical protein [Bacteroidales bacterium]
MQFTVDIRIEQLINTIKKLPANQIEKIKSALNDRIIAEKAKSDISEFQKFLLSGPIMTEEQYNQFKENRKRFNAWRRS